MNMIKKNTFLIAAPRSNSGKTLVTLGLIKALCKTGYKVQPYKCGPDYIDPMHHALVSGQDSYNLDTWMGSPNHVKQLFYSHLQNSDIGIIEGVMGMFDGANKDEGSSAALARLLELPVVLIVDASSVAYSVAPLLHGFKTFDPNINLAGVIFNKTGSETHARILEEGAIDAGVEMLGYIPRDKRLNIESRHLGLHLPEENRNTAIIDIAADLVEKHIDLEKLLRISSVKIKEQKTNPPQETVSDKITCAIANDAAFNFTYSANKDALNVIGKTIPFSPLEDPVIPNADLLWLPGGYPELYGRELSENKTMMDSICMFIEAGKPVIAECGGMMYLGKSIIDKNGKSFDMANVFNHTTSFLDMKLHLGYRKIQIEDLTIKGHEFHYSNLTAPCTAPLISEALTARDTLVEMPVFKYKKCWASYMHLYLGEPEQLKRFINYLTTNE